MPNYCKNTIYVIGTNEAVAEVAMYLCQGHRIEVADSPFRADVTPSAALAHIGSEGNLQYVNKEGVVEEDGWGMQSYGIEMHVGPDESINYVLTAEVTSAWAAPAAALVTLSLRFPDVVVSVLYDENGNAMWGLDAYLAGDSFLALDDHDFPVTDEWRQSEGEASDEESQRMYAEHEEFRNSGALEQLHAAARQKLEQRHATRATDISDEHRSHGWPRWGMHAHAANAGGVSGMRITLAHFADVDETHSALTKEYLAARELDVASWMDTCLFGAQPSSDAPDSNDTSTAYTAFSLDAYVHRQHELLSLFAESQNQESADFRLAKALLASLSDPDARLVCGLHPAAFLTATAFQGNASVATQQGLELLLADLAKKTPAILGADGLGEPSEHSARVALRNELLRSVIAIAAQPRAVPSQLKPALAAGISPAFLLHTLAARTAGCGFANPGSVNPGSILESLKDAYGSVARFPPQLVAEIERIGSSMAASLEALRTAELMEARIETSGRRLLHHLRTMARVPKAAMWPGPPNAEIELLLFKPYSVATAKMARAAGERLDVPTLLAAASTATVVQNRLTALLGEFAACGTSEHGGHAVLGAIERYVGSDANRRQEFEVAAGAELLESCFCALDDASTFDFEHFDAVVGRLGILLGHAPDIADAVASMESAEYWSVMLSVCAPTVDGNGNQLQVGEHRAAFWLALVHRALDQGLTAESPVYKQGGWPMVEKSAGTESFREAVAGRAGPAAAEIYDAVVAQRAMNSHIGPRSLAHPSRSSRRIRLI